MHWQRRSLLIAITLLLSFTSVLFAAPQPTLSPPEQTADDFTLQNDEGAGVDSGVFTAVTATVAAPSPNDAITRSRLVTFNEKGRLALPAAPGTATPAILQLNLFEDVALTAIQSRIEQNASGSYTWFGHVAGVALSDVILVINGPRITGHIALPTATYNITPVKGTLHRIVEINSGAILSGEDDSRIPEPAPNDNRTILAPEASDDGSVIDVMVLYTDDAVATNGVATLQNWIELYMAFTNQAYINSNLAQRAALVYTGEIAYNEPGDNDTALSDLTVKNDGKLDDAHTLRNTYHADLVMLLVNDDGDGPTGSCSGLAWVQTNVVPAGENNGFGVMGACSFGSGVFAHELGHTMGGNHDWFVSTGTSPYPYAHGYVDTTNRFRTIMSYSNRCNALSISCPEITYFSNPAVSYQGAPVGVAGSTPTNCTSGTQPGTECVADIRTTFNNTDSNTAVFRSSQNTWVGTSTDWNDPNNWTMNEGPLASPTAVHRVPRTIDNVFIPTAPTGGNFPTISANADVRDVTIANGAVLNITGGTLNVYGNWEDQGSGQLNATGGTIVFKGILPQTITSSATSSFNHLQIGTGGSSVVTLNSNIDVNGNLTMSAGAVLNGGSSTIWLAGNWVENSPVNFNAGTSTVIMDGTSQNMSKVTTQTVWSENFSGSDGVSCCGTGSKPSGWTNENTVWYFGDSGGTGRAFGTGNGWLHTLALNLSAGVNYNLGFDYVRGTGSSLNVRYGSVANSASMTNVIGSISATGAASFAFTVPTSGVYYIGFQNVFGGGWSNIDNVTLAATNGMKLNNLTIASGTITAASSVRVNGNLAVNSGATADLGSNDWTVEGTVTNNGTLQQTRNISDGSGSTSYEFLMLRNAAGSSTNYYGVQMTPSGGQALGSTTVQIKGNQDCTSNAADPLARRCYNITPSSAQSATIKYWLTEAERNGQTQNALKVWDYNNSAWVQVGTTASYGGGCGSAATCWVQWTGISTYSPMVVGSGTVPTGTPGSSVCGAPTAPTTTGISRAGNTVTVTWGGGVADSFERWHAVNSPYFTPGASCTGTCAANAVSGQNTGFASTPGTNYFYQIVAVKSCGSKVTATKRVGDFSFAITPGTPPTPTNLFSDDMESGSAKWTATHDNAGANNDWALGTANAHSATHAWFAQDVAAVSDQYLTMANTVTPSGTSVLTFWHHYNLEDGFDGGVVEISVNGGGWTDLGAQMTQSGYNGGPMPTNYNSPIGNRNAFTGDSGGYVETKVNLSSFSGSTVRIRFRLATDDSTPGNGWYIDDVTISP